MLRKPPITRDRFAKEKERMWKKAVKKAEEYLETKDLNGNRALSRKELFKKPDADWENMVAHKVLVFDLADRDESQDLSQDEIPVFISPEFSDFQAQFDELRAEEHINQVDKDNDGLLTWEEHRDNILAQSEKGEWSASCPDPCSSLIQSAVRTPFGNDDQACRLSSKRRSSSKKRSSSTSLTRTRMASFRWQKLRTCSIQI